MSAVWPQTGQIGEDSLLILFTLTGDNHFAVVMSHIRFLTEEEHGKLATLFVALYRSSFSMKKFLSVFS